MRFSLLLALLILSAFQPVSAQESPPITADNIHQLQPVLTLDYADSKVTHAFDRGWFAIDASGDYIAVPARNEEGRPRLALWHHDAWQAWDTDHDIAMVALPHDTDDEGAEPHILIALTDDDRVLLYRRSFILPRPEHPPLYAEFTSHGLPIEMWQGDEYIGMEMLVDAGSQILHITPDAIMQRPYAPDTDSSAVVRIGRVPLPYVVTSTLTGVVTLWDIDQNRALASVDNGTDEPAVFGNINTTATHLVWRDNANQKLYLLNFGVGENRFIADLYGEYAQWYFLTEDASVILAVSLGFRPHVYAWVIHPHERTRQRLDLGAYRHCGRPQPDMARISADGTTLVIGCDTGLQLWRIVPDVD